MDTDVTYLDRLDRERRRMRSRMEVAFRRRDMLLTWEIPDDWEWLLGDKKTRTVCKKLHTEAEIREAIAPHCPRVAAGEIPACEHVEEAVRLYSANWGMAVFLTEDASEEEPVLIPDHWHRVDEKLIFIEGRGIFHHEGELVPLYSQDVKVVPAGELHGATLFHPTRVVTGFRTVDGFPNYMGPIE